MSDLVMVSGATAVTNSLVIAEGTGSQHRAVIQLVRNNLADFEEFGGVAFEMRPFDTAGGVQERTVAVLNEQQATLLMTYLRNTEVVRDFKKRLVRAFYEFASARPRLDVESVTRGDLARMVLAAEEEKAVLAAALESAAPAIAYHDRHIAESSDLTLIEDWGRLVGLTKKQSFDTLVERNIIFRKTIGSRWSAKAQRVVEEHEYRARAGRATTDWFELRPQHNAPRLHNGQVRQTLMVKVFYVDQLAAKCGLSRTATLSIDSEVA
ncbi:Rha family transcriptional regulator [Dietzia maris]|uniref:Rha family transcriptional regulator n=1 Tax=Dietzia maris TaxID=37915 RepID=A0AAE4R2B1_9ACTN|nr:Rha family transcriptional regulator [Dietzia maris]MDV6300232.1 Rha family transcriptional regulator [Dietzia maris]